MRRLNRLGALLGVAILVAGGFATAVRAAGGSLDTTFDSDGIAITNLGGTNDFGTSVAIQADGKIVVAGGSNKNGTYDFVLVRYNADGSLDTTFDGDTGTGNGVVITDLGGTNESGSSVAIQADGKIVVAGYSYAIGGYDFALVRYNSNGTLDTTFDSDGIAITNLGSTNDFGWSMAIQGDGKIVVAGYSDASGGYDFALVRYNSNGTLDTTFDSDGIAITNLGGTNDFGTSVAIQADGKIVVAGYSDASGRYDFVLVRYNADGSLDTTFDGDTGTGNGVVITDLGGTNESGSSVAIQADGKIVVAGYSDAIGGYDFALVRYNTNGTLDTAFDGDIGTGNGIVITDLGGTDNEGNSVAIQADGKIVVAGYSDASGRYDFALVRYNSNGSLDTTFDSDGIAIANLGGTDSGSSVAIQTDGKIVVAGASYANGASDLALARFDATQPTLNPPRAPTPTPIVSLHHADLDPNGGSCLMNGTATTTSTRTAFLGYTYIPGAEECSRPGFTFQGWAIQTKPETVFALPLLRGWDDGVWRYFIADTYELIAVWKTIG